MHTSFKESITSLQLPGLRPISSLISLGRYSAGLGVLRRGQVSRSLIEAMIWESLVPPTVHGLSAVSPSYGGGGDSDRSVIVSLIWMGLIFLDFVPVCSITDLLGQTIARVLFELTRISRAVVSEFSDRCSCPSSPYMLPRQRTGGMRAECCGGCLRG